MTQPDYSRLVMEMRNSDDSPWEEYIHREEDPSEMEWEDYRDRSCESHDETVGIGVRTYAAVGYEGTMMTCEDCLAAAVIATYREGGFWVDECQVRWYVR